MVTKDFHDEPFDEESLTKLDIFENYFRKWLPVFLNLKFKPTINVLDLFAGTGRDITGVAGSPIRILKVIKEYREQIGQKGLTINLFLNEYKDKKLALLKSYVEEEREKDPLLLNHVNVLYFNKDFQILWNSLKDKITDETNIIFFDQYGVKQILKKHIVELESFKTTDYMFFISSSFMNRFGEKGFQHLFPDFNFSKIKNAGFDNSHRVILGEFRKLIPVNGKTRLYPFSLEKIKNNKRNVYGLIFGTKHPLGVEKFLDVAWDKNKINGEANFDIDNEFINCQNCFFPVKTKRKFFEITLEEFILNHPNPTNKDIFDFTLEQGHIPKHAVELLARMKKEKKLSFSHAKVSYRCCYKESDIVFYTKV